MSTDISRLSEELATFADLGTDPPHPQVQGSRTVLTIFREGEELELQFDHHGSGRVYEKSLDSHKTRTHASYRALLASDRFGNLRRWADFQKWSLQDVLKDQDQIPVKGLLSDNDLALNLRELDDLLVSQNRHEDSVHVMLIDGPAGIGKTRFIESLAASRVGKFLTTHRPLILHVQSRGRVLTFLQDLIAFSLQRLRLSVTFDQLPILVRHGLVILAIDGFDELGDPNGYDLAWSQVSELVNQVRGRGTLILAGRETFIGRDRISAKITSLNDDRDIVGTLTLEPPHPETARNWLRRRSWTNDNLESVEELFELGSYALRPFFLAQLADPKVVAFIENEVAGNPLAFLVELMIAREATKFGDAVERVMTEEQRRAYVRRIFREVARHMADDQTEAIDERLLTWLVDVVLPEGMSPDVLSMLKNRVSVMAFLENDDVPNSRRFAHTQVQNHFLGEETLDTLTRREMPKYVRRNVLGADFLSAFSDLVMQLAGSSPDRVRGFFEAASGLVDEYSRIDRGVRNLGACLVTMLPAMESTGTFCLRNLDVDEALIRGTVPLGEIKEVVVNQLDVRGADLQLLTFEASTIGTLIVDETTRVPPSIPIASRLRYVSFGSVPSSGLFDPKKIRDWLGRHGRDRLYAGGSDAGLVPEELRDHDIMKLVSRACRSKSYWISQDRESYFDRFVRDPRWPEVLELLEQHELVRVSSRSVSGRSNEFFHVKRPMEILSGDRNDHRIVGFYESLVSKMREY